MVAKKSSLKSHAPGPFIIIIEGCIAVHISSYLREAGIDGNQPETDDVFDRLLDYSEWLEDHFNRGSRSTKQIARLFLKEYSDLDLDAEEVVEALTDLGRDFLKVMEGLDLAIDRAQRPRKRRA